MPDQSRASLPAVLRRAWRYAFAETVALRDVCQHRIDPVPKEDNRVFCCVRPKGHQGEHADGAGSWWSAYERDRTAALTAPNQEDDRG